MAHISPVFVSAAIAAGSLPWFHTIGLPPETQQEIDEMKKLFAGREDDEVALYRFIKGYKWVVADAAAALEKTIEWRKSKGIDAAFQRRAATTNQMDMPHAVKVVTYFPHKYAFICLETYG